MTTWTGARWDILRKLGKKWGAVKPWYSPHDAADEVCFTMAMKYRDKWGK